MYCSNCGKEIEDHLRFCNHCGTPVVPVQQTSVPEQEEPKPSAPTTERSISKTATKKPRKALIVIIVIVLVLVIFFIIGHVSNMKYRNQADQTLQETPSASATAPATPDSPSAAATTPEDIVAFGYDEIPEISDDSRYSFLNGGTLTYSESMPNDGISSSLDEFCASTMYGAWYSNGELRYGPLMLGFWSGEPTVTSEYITPGDCDYQIHVATKDWIIDWDTADMDSIVAHVSEATGASDVEGLFFGKSIYKTPEYELPIIIYSVKSESDNIYLTEYLALNGKQSEFVNSIYAISDNDMANAVAINRFIDNGFANASLVTEEQTHSSGDFNHITNVDE